MRLSELIATINSILLAHLIKFNDSIYFSLYYGNNTNEPQTHFHTIKVQHPRINPEYDANLHYVPRSDRSEWAAVGIMGKLLIRDDGSCRVNGFCWPDAEGVATFSEKGYRVLERLAKDMVLIYVK